MVFSRLVCSITEIARTCFLYLPLVLLVSLTGAPLYPVTMHYEGSRAIGVVHDQIEVPQYLPKSERVAHMTQQVARAFEVGIAQHPEDWHMLQNIWLEDRSPR